MVLISAAIVAGSLAGSQKALAQQEQMAGDLSAQALAEQFALGVSDLEAGRYQVARQRLDFVMKQDPTYPGLAEHMATLLTILYATATPSPVIITPTVTLTPTPDLRPLFDRYDHIVSLLKSGEWAQVIEALLNFRKDEPEYQIARVDGMFYLALRQQGVAKIYQQSNLEGGIYDLSLAENFGPLDLEAQVARNMARLYLYGSSFWEAYPEKAVFYFGQVASAMPYLRDGSGWTATERYRGALIQYGDQLANQGDWCAALEQYQAAASIRGDAALVRTIDQAAEACLPPTETPASSLTPTPTISPTPTATWILPTDTIPAIPPTNTSPPPTDTPTLPPIEPPPPTVTPAPPTEPPPPPPSETQPAP